ncbi:MAG: PLP-dependent aminotransferase family protein [Halioglobus sp.]
MSANTFSHLFYLGDVPRGKLSERIREMLVDRILGGQHPLDAPLPSSRGLAIQLGVARTTITEVYSALVSEGLIISKDRSGYYICPEYYAYNKFVKRVDVEQTPGQATGDRPNWASRFRVRPSTQRNISKPNNWQSFPYKFISGQIDFDQFPIREWRECSRRALSLNAFKKGGCDSIGEDDPDLVDQVRKRLLPRRGVIAQADEILVTVGSQNALYMIARLLLNRDTKVAIEAPGYPDARNIFDLRSDNLLHIPVDEQGIVINHDLESCDYVYVTPSHQVPTTVTMPLARRKLLLEKAAEHDFVIFEDDYESEVNFDSTALPSLKSIDRNDRVIYFSSVSKTLAPGLRVGYLVAPRELIKEVRSLRRLMLRHAPTHIQQTLSLFLAQGSYDTLANRLKATYERRWRMLLEAIDRHLPSCKPFSARGGSTVWIRGPASLDSVLLAKHAAEEGILIEPGDIYFPETQWPCPWFRLGFASIKESDIDPGIEKLAGLLDGATTTNGTTE